MAFFEERFDTRLSFGSRGGPMWNTSVAKVQSGRRSANRNWSAPLHRYNVAHAVKSNEDFEIVRAFFYVVSGQFDGFRFKDWSDYQATQANSTATFISGTNWQLQRKYVVGARTYLRDIQKPLSGVVVRRFRAGVWSTAVATVTTTTGVAAITGHSPGDVYAWIGEFDVPVAFLEDRMEADIVDRGSEFLVRWGQITLEEIRL